MTAGRRPLLAAVFVVAHICLIFGLFGILVDYTYFITITKEMFESCTDKESSNLLLLALGFAPQVEGQKAVLIPRNERALLANGLIAGHSDNGGQAIIPWLFEEARNGRSGYLAPCTLVFFGVVLPSLKFLLVVLWALGPSQGWLVFRYRKALTLAQRLSRWTAVDAVAEAIVVSLLLKGNVDAAHGPGYVAFVSYVVLSSLAINACDSGEKQPPCLFNLGLSKASLKPVLISLLALYCILLLVGAAMLPLGRLRVDRASVISDATKLIESIGGPAIRLLGDDMAKKLAEALVSCSPLPKGEASLLQCAGLLLGSGHPYTIAGSVVLFVMVLCLPLVEAFLSVGFVASGASETLHRILHLVSDLALLDVFVFGIFVGCVVTSSVGSLEAELLPGYYVLVVAALLGALIQFLSGPVIAEAASYDKFDDATSNPTPQVFGKADNLELGQVHEDGAHL